MRHSSRHRAHSNAARALLATALACAAPAPPAPEPPALSAEPLSAAPPEPALGEAASLEATAPSAAAAEPAAAAADPWPSAASPATGDGVTSVATPASAPASDALIDPGERASGPSLIDFIGIGRGERVADLGAGTGYSIEDMADAVGPAGVVYVRRDPRTLAALPSEPGSAKPSGALPSNIVLMTTSADALLAPAAKDLNVVTLLYAYGDLVARHVDRKRLNLAVYRALSPRGSYVIAEHPPAAGASAAEASAAGRVDEQVVRREVEEAGFVFVNSAELVSNMPTIGRRGARPYILKFRKPG